MRGGTIDRRGRFAMSGVVAFVAAVAVAGCSDDSGTADIRAFRSSDGLTLGLEIDTCNADLTLESLEETPEAVKVTITYDNDKVDDDCGDGFVVELSEPLNKRPVIDGSDGDRVGRRRAPGK